MTLKERKKKTKIISALLAYVSLFLLTGYTLPDENTPYVVVNCNFGNNFVMGFPADQAKYLAVNGNEIINTSANTIYAYCSDGERITFPTFNTPYRSYNYQNQTSLVISDIIENHLADYSSTSLFENNKEFVNFAVLGGLLLCGLLLVVKR